MSQPTPRQQYDREGYAIYREVIDPNLVAEASDHVDWLLAKNPGLRPEQLHNNLMTHDPFWELDVEHWDQMFAAGVRSTLVAARLAVPLMVPNRSGLIVNTTAPIKQTYHGNVLYDVAKTAVTRMSSGMAADLREHDVAVIALAPGWMRTERVLDHFGTDEHRWRDMPELGKTESPRYAGRAVAALAADPELMQRSGQLCEVGELAKLYGFTDIDGRQVAPFSALFPELFET